MADRRHKYHNFDVKHNIIEAQLKSPSIYGLLSLASSPKVSRAIRYTRPSSAWVERPRSIKHTHALMPDCLRLQNDCPRGRP